MDNILNNWMSFCLELQKCTCPFFTSKHVYINVDDHNEDKQLYRRYLWAPYFFCSTLNMLLYLWSNLLWSMSSDRNTPWDLGGSDAENAVGWGFLGFIFILGTQKASVKISKVHSSFDYWKSLLVRCRNVTSVCVCLVWAIVLVTPHAFSVCFFPVLCYPVYFQWWVFFFPSPLSPS